MVLISMLRRTAAKRIPLIKFRRQREEEMAAARSGSVLSGGQKGKSSSSPAAVSLLGSYPMREIQSLISLCKLTNCMSAWNFSIAGD